MKVKQVILLVILVSGAFHGNLYSQENPFAPKSDSIITIASGAESGSYFKIANNIADIYGKNIKIQPSLGAVNNYQLILNNPDIDIAIVQYDVLLKGKQFDYENKTKVSENIKVLLPLGGEEIHLITGANSGIMSLSDLSGKKVGVGNPVKEGTYITAGLIKSVSGVNWTEIPISFDSAFVALLKGDIDALFFVGYAPIQKLSDLLPTYNQLVKLIPLENDKLNQFHKKSSIEIGTYPWLDYNVQTYSVMSYLVANVKNESPQDLINIEKLLRSIKGNIGEYQAKGHPVWKQVDFDFSNCKWELHPVAKKVFNLK